MFFEEQDKKRDRVLKIGGEALSEALHLYGFCMTIDFMVRISKEDWIVDELLTMLPSLSLFSQLLKRSIIFEVDADSLLKKLEKDPNWLKNQGII